MKTRSLANAGALVVAFVARIMASVFAWLQRRKEFLPPRLDLYLCILLTLAAFAVYVRTLTPGVLDGDSGEWQYMANILGVPHSTGYPTYILLAKLVTLLPIGNPAWRVNLFSTISAALTIPVVYLLAKRVSRSRLAALFAAIFFAFMPTLWAAATIAEVYALNTLLIAPTLFFAIRFFDHGRARDLYLVALCFGLALTNHRIAFFIAPALLLIVWLKRDVLNLKKISLAALISLFALSFYLYIPLRASQLLAEQSAENWALYPRAEAIVNGKVTAYYNHTPAGFFNLVTALDNRTKLGFQDAGGENKMLERLTNAWTLLREQIDPFGMLLALWGIVVLWRRERALTSVLLLAGASVAAISIYLRAESTRFYFSGAYLVMVLFFAAALGWILEKLRPGGVGAMLNARPDQQAGEHKASPLRNARTLLYYAVIVFFAFFPLSAFYFNFARMDQSGNTKYDAYARAVLGDNLAQNAVVVAPWEVATPMRYFQYVENVRPDVLTIHESPVRPQYQKILDAAHKLNRPFYYAQFMPEDKNSDAPRTVQAIAFPLSDKPQPQQTLNAKLNDSIRVIGYDWIPSDPQNARLAIYYRVLQPTRIEYVNELELSDTQGVTRAAFSRHPVSEYYPTYFWQDGGYYRDVYDIHLDANAPRGAYSAELIWYEYDAATAQRNEYSAKSVIITGLERE
ncbi:MAG: DUF2723 domain-containing protein [Chloroflexi bacterium]|nr:DUF2723 domain-containing protein [Chloroflexota bacterium]